MHKTWLDPSTNNSQRPTASLVLGGRQHTPKGRAPSPEGPTPAQARVGRTALSTVLLMKSRAPAAWADVPEGCPGADRRYKYCTLISELSPSMHSAYRPPIKSRVLTRRSFNKRTFPVMHVLTRVSPRSRCHFFLSYFQRMHVISFNLYRAIKVPDQTHKHPSNCIMKTQWARKCSGTVSERTEIQYIL